MMRFKGFEIKELVGERFKVKLKEKDGSYYESICESFLDAGNWVWNMADNHDIAYEVENKMCDVFGKVFFD